MSTRSTDWRLRGQERYLKGQSVRLQKFQIRNADWEHEHCIFCWRKIVDDPAKYSRQAEVIVEAYATKDEKHWICPQCLSHFHQRFQLKLIS